MQERCIHTRLSAGAVQIEQLALIFFRRAWHDGHYARLARLLFEMTFGNRAKYLLQGLSGGEVSRIIRVLGLLELSPTPVAGSKHRPAVFPLAGQVLPYLLPSSIMARSAEKFISNT